MMDSLFGTVLFTENLERERYIQDRVHLIDSDRQDELLVSIDNKIVASVQLRPQKLLVRDIEGTLIGYFDCPPSGVKEAVLDHFNKHGAADNAQAAIRLNLPGVG